MFCESVTGTQAQIQSYGGCNLRPPNRYPACPWGKKKLRGPLCQWYNIDTLRTVSVLEMPIKQFCESGGGRGGNHGREMAVKIAEAVRSDTQFEDLIPL